MKSASFPPSREARIYGHAQEKTRRHQTEFADATAPVADVSAEINQAAVHLRSRPQIQSRHEHPPGHGHGRNRHRLSGTQWRAQ